MPYVQLLRSLFVLLCGNELLRRWVDFFDFELFTTNGHLRQIDLRRQMLDQRSEHLRARPGMPKKCMQVGMDAGVGQLRLKLGKTLGKKSRLLIGPTYLTRGQTRGDVPLRQRMNLIIYGV